MSLRRSGGDAWGRLVWTITVTGLRLVNSRSPTIVVQSHDLEVVVSIPIISMRAVERLGVRGRFVILGVVGGRRVVAIIVKEHASS